jgi:hemoglobin
MSAPELSAHITSARPEMTAAIMAETGLDEDIRRDLIHSFYDKVRREVVLEPIFAARIADWGRTWSARSPFGSRSR